MQKHLKTGVAIAAGLAVVAVFFIFNGSLQFSAAGTENSGLVMQDVVVGTGAAVAAGDIVTVHYVGKLEDGTVFESSAGGDPVDVPIGLGYVIPGWDQGLIGMKEGGKRLLVIPPALAYGEAGRAPVPPNATLVFEIELVKVQKAQ
jgi:FKBP-type peptidyl-prolyl cis-trans isomerase